MKGCLLMLGEKIYITEEQSYTIVGTKEREQDDSVDLVMNLELRDDCTGEVGIFGLWTLDYMDEDASLYVCLPTDEPEYEDDETDIFYLEHSLSGYGVKAA